MAIQSEMVYAPEQIPSLARRYTASAIDGLFLTFIIIIAANVPGDSEFLRLLRGSFMVLPILTYEPFLTAYGVTLGQRLLGIRVRLLNNAENRISLLQSYSRWVTKLLLGFLSFIVAFFTENRRTIHDMVARSIVLRAQSPF